MMQSALSRISCAIFATIAIVAYSRFGCMVQAGFSLFPGELNIGQVQKDDCWMGETDLGNIIPLFHFDADERQFQSFASTFESRFPNFSNTLITRHSADKEANCHGWVFTDGRFLIRGESVEKVLKDNRYRIVTDPIATDLIIYRDIAGNVLHTAIVRAVLDDGTVLAESKWGIDKRFIHLPEHQPYSNNFSYHRSNRKDHLIMVHRVDPETIATMIDD